MVGHGVQNSRKFARDLCPEADAVVGGRGPYLRQILGPVWRYALLLSGSTVRIHKGIVVDWHRGDHRRLGTHWQPMSSFGVFAGDLQEES